MATVEVRDASGEVLGERELPEDLFGVPINVPLMHQVVVAGAAAQRAGTHSTKTRGEVRGGGVKPWRQKGTGRARQGSIRSPQWVGGGVAHGPKPRSYEMRVNRKMKKGALRSALTDSAASGKLVVVDTLAFDGPRTKDALGVLSALEVQGRVLLVLAAPDEAIERSFRNLAAVKIGYPGNLSTFDLIYADRVVFTGDALDALTGETTERLAPQSAAEAPDATDTASPDEPDAEAPDEADAEPEPEPAVEPEEPGAEEGEDA